MRSIWYRVSYSRTYHYQIPYQCHISVSLSVNENIAFPCQ